MFSTALFSILYLCAGTASLWAGIMFMNGTLWVSGLGAVYGVVSQPLLRMLLVLPILGLGHLCFSLAIKTNPVVASPASIVFTVVPPVIYALWLLHAYPSGKIMVYIGLLILVAILLGLELNRVS